MKRVMIPTVGLWVVFLAMHGYCFWIHDQWHPSFVPILVFLLFQLMFFLVGGLMVLWRILLGPRRVETFGWGMLLLLPVFIWYSQLSLTFQTARASRTEQIEDHWYLDSFSRVADAMIDALVYQKLPSRLEGERVVMFHDHRIENPQKSLDEMEDFLQSEAAYLGVEMPAKVHWVRDSIFGFPGFAPLGIAVSDPDHDDGYASHLSQYETLTHTDLHEAAHNVSFAALKKTFPPMLLLEGWAESRTLPRETYAYQCLKTKEAGAELSLQEMISPRYRYSADPRIYYQGAALTHSLIEKFGIEKFRELFSTCEPETFADDVERIYGMTLDELETFYWQEIANDFSLERAIKGCSDEEKALLEEYRQAWQKQKADYSELLGNCTVNATIRTVSGSKTDPEKTICECDIFFRSREGRFFRVDTKTHSNEEENYPYDLLNMDLILPNRIFYVDKWDCPQDYENALNTEGHYLPDPRLALICRQQDFEKLSPEMIFNDQSQSALLWNPMQKLTVKSVVRKSEDCVVITIRDERDDSPAQYRLTVDPSQNWLLREVKWIQTPQLFSCISMKETRNYEGEYKGTPLLNSVLIEKNVFRRGLVDSQETTNMQFIRIDPVAAPESVFTEKSLGVGSIPVEGLPTQPYRRMDRHQRLIVVWLLVSIAVIVIARRSCHAPNAPECDTEPMGNNPDLPSLDDVSSTV